MPKEANKSPTWILSAISISIGVIIPLLLLELFMRVMPVTESRAAIIVNRENPIIRYPANTTRTYSFGWRFQVSQKKWVNNYGFLSNIDYTPDAQTPLLMLIGDSYIEASSVADHHTVHAILHHALEDTGRVYAIGISGSPLSQYLAFARYARETFQPDAMTFSIVANDFDESLLKYRAVEGMHYFANVESHPKLIRLDTQSNSLSIRHYARQSALMRYLFLTVNIDWRTLLRQDRQRYIGNVHMNVSPQRLADAYTAIDAFFTLLPEVCGLPPDRIQFIIDAIRPSIYDPDELEQAKHSYFTKTRLYFINQANQYGYEVIDLQQIFLRQYQDSGTYFENYPYDAHWNEAAHHIIAKAIERSQLFTTVFRTLAQPFNDKASR